MEITKTLLATTVSTKERLNYYESVYKHIFEITGDPSTIIDIGAGINPLSFPFMDLDFVNYHAYDIDEKDVTFLNEYFKIMREEIDGCAEILDVRSAKTEYFPHADIVFLFKVVDLLDTKKKKYSYELIRGLLESNKANYIIASFATKTLTRKKMNLQRRVGFEKALARLNFQWKDFSIENEIFYVIYR